MASSPTPRKTVASLVAGTLLLLGGCATNGDPRDPLEPLNRGIYSFNRHVDELAVKPMATLYRDAIPDPIRNRFSNFFDNLRDVVTAINNLLQGKFEESMSDLSRVVWNSTIGIAGMFDVASEMGLEKHNEDLGQTLAHWGVGDGFYLMLPILGPSTLRDTVGLAGDVWIHPITQVEGSGARNALWGVDLVDLRYRLLPSDKVLDEAALDRYNFVREAYLQRRRNLIWDGYPPPEELEESK